MSLKKRDPWPHLRLGHQPDPEANPRAAKERTENSGLTISPITDKDGTTVGAAGIGSDITERKRAERAALERERRLRARQATLLALAKRKSFHTGDLAEAWKALTEAAARGLAVERASVWLYTADRSELRCADLYELFADRHSEGGTLQATDFPQYFAALEEDRAIAAHDARTDARTREFSASYLSPLGITSMLDAPIRFGGTIAGVLRHEEVGPPRRWTPEEESFAGSLADIASLALEAGERRRAEEALVNTVKTLRIMEQEAIRKSDELMETPVAVDAERQRYLDLFNFAPGAYLTTDLEGTIREANRAAAAALGIHQETIIGKPLALFVSGEAKPAFRNLFQRLSDGEVKDFEEQEITMLPRGRAPFPAALTASLVRGADGRPTGARWLIHDLTERRQAAERIRTSEAELNAIYAAMTDAIFVLDAEGRAIKIPPTATVRPVAHLTGKKVHDLFPAEEADFLLSQIRRVLETKQTAHLEYRLTVEGKPCWFTGAVSPLTKRSVLWISRDITERKRTEEALRQREKLASMGSLLAGVAHELNNPLSVIIGRTALLQQMAENGRMAAQTEKIAQAAERCTRIVRNFLALARQRPPERKAVQVNEVVQGALELLAYPLRVDNVEITLDSDSEAPSIWADPDQLHQVMVNLITNAHYAMRGSPPPRRLKLSTRFDRATNRLTIELKDTGPGIPPEIQERIFEPFFTTKPLGEGTGLGLSLCQGMIEEHGGTISVQSRPGDGTAFRIELPVTAPAEEGATHRVRPSPRVHGKKILVVDDELEIANLLADLLAVDGHKVETAGNGAAALKKLQGEHYDLILSDVRMPVLDGPGLYREVEGRHPDLHRRVIFITGDALNPETKEWLGKVDAPNLAKPFVVEEIRRVIRETLET